MSPLERTELTAKLVRLADGDRSAFEPIFEVTWPLVHRFAARLIGSGHEAEDVAQHALMKVFSRAHEFDGNRDALSWILGITAFECKTLRQKVRRRKEEFGSSDALNGAHDQSMSAEERLITDKRFAESAGDLETLARLHRFKCSSDLDALMPRQSCYPDGWREPRKSFYGIPDDVKDVDLAAPEWLLKLSSTL